ncbi:Rieske (2Fe-2S) protein [Dactylosporangium sp. CA-152071]|uniref:Rieske (2Fe-2S) protein n=1 Tax=Dactylosporangium sp. CA-152071 TaxID=3239933 RepID=UPI003D8EFBD8
MTIDLRRHNTVLAGDERYFLFHDAGRAWMVHDRCPHRGGPLSLGRRTPDGRRLTCPWHGTKVGVAALCRTALPMVRTGDTATVVLPAAPLDPGGPVTVIHRHILANLPTEGERNTDATA